MLLQMVCRDSCGKVVEEERMRAPLHTHTSVVWGVESLCVLALELGRE